MVQNTIQLIQTIIKNCHFSLSLGGMLDLDFGSQLFGQFVLKTANIRIDLLTGFFGCCRSLQTPHQVLGFPHRKASREDLFGRLHLHGTQQGQQGPSMAHLKLARFQHHLYLGLKCQQA